MDDVPAGPASPGPRRPSLSVVVPVQERWPRLRALPPAASRLPPGRLRADRRRRRLDRRLGRRRRTGGGDRRPIRRPRRARPPPATAAPARPRPRSSSSSTPTSPSIPGTLDRALARFEADPGLSALFGSYDDAPTAPGVVSQYRNLLHHFVHQQGDFADDVRPVHTFWTGCGMIRREVFLAFGGFDPRLYPRPAIEDIELGYRLTRAGHRIVLARDVLATHMKRWTLRRDGPHRHLPPRRPLDAPDQADRDRGDRPQRQGGPEARASP